jgi:hypothetical protein
MLISRIALTNSLQNSRYDNDTNQIDIIRKNQLIHIAVTQIISNAKYSVQVQPKLPFFYEVMRIISLKVSRKTACKTTKETHIYRDIWEATNMIPVWSLSIWYLITTTWNMYGYTAISANTIEYLISVPILKYGTNWILQQAKSIRTDKDLQCSSIRSVNNH